MADAPFVQSYAEAAGMVVSLIVAALTGRTWVARQVEEIRKETDDKIANHRAEDHAEMLRLWEAIDRMREKIGGIATREEQFASETRIILAVRQLTP